MELILAVVLLCGFAAASWRLWRVERAILARLESRAETPEEADELHEEVAPEETRETESERRAREAIERFNTGVAEILRYDGEKNDED